MSGEQQESGLEAASAAETPAPTDLPALQQRLEEERQRAESYYSSWQRAAADFANYKRRTEQERAETSRFANSLVILHLLPVLDDLERALASVPRELAGFTWVDGVHLIYRKLYAALEAQGLAPIEAVGQSFDPTVHEAVLRASGPDGQVLNELQRGYTLQGRVIRPAMVTVGAGGGSAGGQEPQSSPDDATPS